MNGFTVNHLGAGHSILCNVRKPFKIMLIFHAPLVRKSRVPLPDLSLFSALIGQFHLSGVINSTQRSSTKLVQRINQVAHKNPFASYMCLVFKHSPQSINAANWSPAYLTVPLLACVKKNVKNPKIWTLHVKAQTHAAF